LFCHVIYHAGGRYYYRCCSGTCTTRCLLRALKPFSLFARLFAFFWGVSSAKK
jgi:hypothetical protein